ncbi:MAG: hypothetical protein R3F20_04970 [Planctomycetota bacterium]
MTARIRLCLLGMIGVATSAILVLGPGFGGGGPPGLDGFGAGPADLRLATRDLETLVEPLREGPGAALLGALAGEDALGRVAAGLGDLLADRGPGAGFSGLLEGELAVTWAAAVDEAALDPGQRSPDARRPLPFRRLVVAWRPRRFTHRLALAWAFEPPILRGVAERLNRSGAGAEASTGRLLIREPGRLFGAEFRAGWRPLPPLEIRREGDALVARLEGSNRGPAPAALAPPPARGLLSARLSSGLAAELSPVLRGLLTEVGGRALARLIALDANAEPVLVWGEDGESGLRASFASRALGRLLPDPPPLGGAFATAVVALRPREALHRLAEAADADLEERARASEDLLGPDGTPRPLVTPWLTERFRPPPLGILTATDAPPVRIAVAIPTDATSLEPDLRLDLPAAPEELAAWRELRRSWPELRATDDAAEDVLAVPRFAGPDVRGAPWRLLFSADAVEVRIPDRAWPSDEGAEGRAPARPSSPRPAVLRARIDLPAALEFVSRGAATRIARDGMPGLAQRARYEEETRRDLAYALGRDPEPGEDREFDALVAERVARRLSHHRDLRGAESRRRMARVERLRDVLHGEWRLDVEIESDTRRVLVLRPVAR